MGHSLAGSASLALVSLDSPSNKKRAGSLALVCSDFVRNVASASLRETSYSVVVQKRVSGTLMIDVTGLPRHQSDMVCISTRVSPNAG